MKRFLLSLYRQILRRHRLPTFLLAVLLLFLGLITWLQSVPWPQPTTALWLLGASLIATLYWLFCLFGPSLAYAQPRPDHLRLHTPFYRLNISYRRIRNTRPVDIAQAFPSKTTPPALRRTMQHFSGMTALGIDLSSWPLPRWLLSLLLGKMMLTPDRPGLILITHDWMALSNQLETMMSAWGEGQRQRDWQPGTDVAGILNADEDDH